jgi:hypothetical protein
LSPPRQIRGRFAPNEVTIAPSRGDGGSCYEYRQRRPERDTRQSHAVTLHFGPHSPDTHRGLSRWATLLAHFHFSSAHRSIKRKFTFLCARKARNQHSSAAAWSIPSIDPPPPFSLWLFRITFICARTTPYFCLFIALYRNSPLALHVSRTLTHSSPFCPIPSAAPCNINGRALNHVSPRINLSIESVLIALTWPPQCVHMHMHDAFRS